MSVWDAIIKIVKQFNLAENDEDFAALLELDNKRASKLSMVENAALISAEAIDSIPVSESEEEM